MDNNRITIDGKIYYQMSFDDMHDLAHNAFMFTDALPCCIPDNCCKDRIYLVCNFKNG